MKREPAEDLLDKVEEIGNIKREISLAQRSMVSGNTRLYVQSGNLPDGTVQYMAGGRKLLADLVFERRADGTRTVRKYKPGDWELRVGDALSLCRALYRVNRIPDWPSEKSTSYYSSLPVNDRLLEKIVAVFTQHGDAVAAFINDTSDEVGRELAVFTIDELEREWPLEYLEMVAALGHKESGLAAEVFHDDQIAYSLGYMTYEGWISWPEAENWCAMLAHKRSHAVRSALGVDSIHCQSKATGFAASLTALARIGALHAGTRAKKEERARG